MLDIKHVTKVFFPGTVNEKVALEDINLTINEGDVIIKGNGIIDSTNNNNYIPIQIKGGTLTIENGTFKGNDNVLDIKEKDIMAV